MLKAKLKLTRSSNHKLTRFKEMPDSPGGQKLCKEVLDLASIDLEVNLFRF